MWCRPGWGLDSVLLSFLLQLHLWAVVIRPVSRLAYHSCAEDSWLYVSSMDVHPGQEPCWASCPLSISMACPTSTSDSVCPKVNRRLVHPHPTLLFLQSSPSEWITTASCYLLRLKPYPLSATPAAVPQHLLLLANTRSPTTSHHLTATTLLWAATLSCLNYRSGLPVVFPLSPAVYCLLSLSPVIRWSFQHVKSDHFTPLCQITHGFLWCSKEKPVSMRWPIRPWTSLPPVASLGQFGVTPKASSPYRAFACTAGPCL